MPDGSQDLDGLHPWERDDWQDEPELTREQADEQWAKGEPVTVDVSPDLAPICHFSRDTEAVERRAFRDAVKAFLSTPMGPALPDAAPILELLPDDLLGAWQREIEAVPQTVIVTDNDPWEGLGHPVIITLTRADLDVNEALDADPLDWCNITASHSAWDAAGSALWPCRYFWWSSPAGLVAFEVQVLFPLGYQPGDEDDPNRVAIPLPDDSPECVQEAFDKLLNESSDDGIEA